MLVSGRVTHLPTMGGFPPKPVMPDNRLRQQGWGLPGSGVEDILVRTPWKRKNTNKLGTPCDSAILFYFNSSKCRNGWRRCFMTELNVCTKCQYLQGFQSCVSNSYRNRHVVSKPATPKPRLSFHTNLLFAFLAKLASASNWLAIPVLPCVHVQRMLSHPAPPHHQGAMCQQKNVWSWGPQPGRQHTRTHPLHIGSMFST